MATTGEHLLRYPDGDTEWVRIGEDHTTNHQYKEYYRNHSLGNNDTHNHNHNHHHHHAADANAEADVAAAIPSNQEHSNHLTRLPSLGNGGVSFALSNMSQSFGLHCAEEETAMNLKGPAAPSQQQRLFQQLDLDRTASSMSSFGMYGGGIVKIGVY